MNVEMLKKSDMILFEAICGSIAYATNTKDSDVDIRGLFKLPKEDYFTLLDIPQEVSNDTQDIKYYELKKFIKLASDCNPSIIELCWLPNDCIKIQTPIMDKLIDNRNLFISKKAYHTFSGYAYSMLHKAKSQNRFVNNPKPETRPTKEDFCWILSDREFSRKSNLLLKLTSYFTDISKLMPFRPTPLKLTNINLKEFHCSSVEHVANTYRLYRYGKEAKGVFRGDNMLVPESISIEDEIDKFWGLLIYNQNAYEKELNEWKSYWEWRKSRNEARWVDQEKGLFQFDRKNALHCVRLILSGINILTSGEPIVRFEGKELQYLRDIRAGNIEYEALMADIENKMKTLEEISNKSTLPWGADMNKINKLYKELMDM